MADETLTSHEVVDAANRQAVEHWRARRYDEACRLLQELLDARRDLTPDEVVRTRNNLAMCERARGDFAAALRSHQEAAPLVDRCRDAALRGKFYMGLGITRLHFGDRDGAFEAYTAASVFYEEAGERRLRADVENNLAVIQIEEGRFDVALDHLARALGSCPSPAVEAQVEDTLAMLALARGERRRALESAVESVARLLNLDEPHLLSGSVRTLRRAAREWGREEEAERLRQVLADCDWNVRRAAERLGFNSRQALENYLRRKFPEVGEERRHAADARRRK